MKFGVDTWLWASVFEEKHLHCIEKAAGLGAEAIDFSINAPELFPTREAARAVQRTGLTAVTSTALPAHCNPISNNPVERKAALDYMKQMVDITFELGGKVTGGVNYTASGYHSGKPRSQQEIEWCADYLSRLTDYASGAQVDVALEPVKRFESHFINTAAQALEMIEMVGAENLKVHLDTFHMNIEEANPAEAIRMCGNKLAHMHLVDNNRGAPGMGHIDWVEIIRALDDIGYEGAACIETFNPETIEATCSMTYLTRKFADTPEDLVEKGLRTLQAASVLAKRR